MIPVYCTWVHQVNVFECPSMIERGSPRCLLELFFLSATLNFVVDNALKRRFIRSHAELESWLVSKSYVYIQECDNVHLPVSLVKILPSQSRECS